MAEKDLMEEQEELRANQYMTFRTGNELFSISVRYVSGIIGMQTITFVPELDSYIKGVINLRGMVVPVIDMRVRFRMEEIAYTERTCIIIVELQSVTIGLIVESIAGVAAIDERDIMPPPALGHKDYSANAFVSGFAQGADGSMKQLIDPERLINDDDRRAIEKIKEEG